MYRVIFESDMPAGRLFDIVLMVLIVASVGVVVLDSVNLHAQRYPVVLIMGTLMYVVEGPRNGFTSIPVAVYWAITTMTTVGFGDITPKTDLGRAIASVMMLMGWGVLAVPTGIVTAEMVQEGQGGRRARGLRCPSCRGVGLTRADYFCRHCGAALQSRTGETPL
jgi:hypothetical protein